jgi:hypothetical protein
MVTRLSMPSSKRVAEKFARYLLEPPGERIPGACRRRRQNGLIIVNI